MTQQELIDALRTILKQRLGAIQERDALVPAYEDALKAFQAASATVNELQDNADKLFAELRTMLEIF